MLNNIEQLTIDADILERAAQIAENYMQHGLGNEIGCLAQELKWRSEQ